MKEQLLLTIAIPTYNRATLLCKTMDSIIDQVLPYSDKVEIVISDNCSQDNTEVMVSRYLAQNVTRNIKYIKNSKNIGADDNFEQCYNLARGKYLMIFSDDDFFLPGALGKIMKIIDSAEEQYGLIHVGHYWFNGDFVPRLSMEKNETLIMKDKELFLKKVSYNITFTSANIFNRQLIYNDFIDGMTVFKNTNLLQVPWFLSAALKGEKNVFIGEQLIAAKANNTGGYPLARVFGENYISIMRTYLKKGLDYKVFDRIQRELLKDFFPSFIGGVKAGSVKSKFKQEKMFVVLARLFFLKKEFWIYTVPAMFPWLKFHIFYSEIIKNSIFTFFYRIKRAYENSLWRKLRVGFNGIGSNSLIEYPWNSIQGESYITIGDNFIAHKGLWLAVYEQKFKYSEPKIIIGNNVCINYDCQITAINKIIIGEDVLIGSRVLITDHFHGDSTVFSTLNTSPLNRPLISRGAVIIGDKVWIGSGAAIMPGVEIGNNCIIGANSVVTKSFPENCVIGGNPAKIIKQL